MGVCCLLEICVQNPRLLFEHTKCIISACPWVRRQPPLDVSPASLFKVGQRRRTREGDDCCFCFCWCSRRISYNLLWKRCSRKPGFFLTVLTPLSKWCGQRGNLWTQRRPLVTASLLGLRYNSFVRITDSSLKVKELQDVSHVCSTPCSTVLYSTVNYRHIRSLFPVQTGNCDLLDRTLYEPTGTLDCGVCGVQITESEPMQIWSWIQPN